LQIVAAMLPKERSGWRSFFFHARRVDENIVISATLILYQLA
jgi:hypothetical protein